MEDIELYPIRTSLASAKGSFETASAFGLKELLIKKNHESPPSDNATFDIPMSFLREPESASLNNDPLSVSKDLSPSVSSTTEPHMPASPEPRTVVTLRNPSSGVSTNTATNTAAVVAAAAAAGTDLNGDNGELPTRGTTAATKKSLRKHYWLTGFFVALFLISLLISILFAKGVFKKIGNSNKDKEAGSKEQVKRKFELFRLFFRQSMFFVFLLIYQLFQVYLNDDDKRGFWRRPKTWLAIVICAVFTGAFVAYASCSAYLKAEPYGVLDYVTTALGSILALGSTFALLIGHSTTHARE